jgi:hypothetical protein
MALVSALLYALFAIAGALAILSLVSLGGYLTVWRGLDFPLSARVGLSLLGAGATLAAIGYGIYRLARRAL